MIQPDDELGQIDFAAEIHQLAEHALNPNLARRALQFESSNQKSYKCVYPFTLPLFYNLQLRIT